jgi:hypothetical protein
MTTYDGRAASFVPGKEVFLLLILYLIYNVTYHHDVQVPNREPPVSKFVVEKLYKVVFLLIISFIIQSITCIYRFIENGCLM